MGKLISVYETVKDWSEKVTRGYAPWWVVPVGLVVLVLVLI